MTRFNLSDSDLATMIYGFESVFFYVYNTGMESVGQRYGEKYVPGAVAKVIKETYPNEYDRDYVIGEYNTNGDRLECFIKFFVESAGSSLRRKILEEMYVTYNPSISLEKYVGTEPDMDNLELMAKGFRNVVYYIYNTGLTNVEAYGHEDEDWCVPGCIMKMNLGDKSEGDRSYIYSKYPQRYSRIMNFIQFFKDVDNTIRTESLRWIMENYDCGVK